MNTSMRILLRYLKPYKGLIAFTLLLAAINTVFSLFDPIVFGKIIKVAEDLIDDRKSGDGASWETYTKRVPMARANAVGASACSSRNNSGSTSSSSINKN